MKGILITSGAVAVAGLSVRAPSTDCCFTLTASGKVGGGVLGQLDDGQNRFGPAGLPTGQYCLKNGVITDKQGRGCILTPPTTQFQCDVGAKGTPGFSTKGSQLLYNGSPRFVACPVDAYGNYNIYTEGVSNQCVDVELTTSGSCKDESSSSAPHVPVATSHKTSKASMHVETHVVTITTTKSPCSSIHSTPCPVSESYVSHPVASTHVAVKSPPDVHPAPEAPSHCPADLNGAYQRPYIIKYVHNSNGSIIPESQYSPIMDHEFSTYFAFGVPADWEHKTCSLIFTWPLKSQLETSDYNVSGQGDLVFQPVGDSGKGVIKNAQPGTSHVVYSEPCNPGKVEAVVTANKSLSLSYFQDYNPAPIGVWYRAC